MKKVVLAGIVTVFAASTAFASSVPVTDIQEGNSKVSAEYSFAQRVSGNGSDNDGFGVSIETGLTDRWAVQYGYHKTNLRGHDLNDHQAAAVYRINDNFNAYGALTLVDAGDDNWGLQAGVIGHMPLTDRIEGFAKFGIGDDIEQSYQLGAKYNLTESWDLNAYYAYDKYDIGGTKESDKGFHVGAGYKF